MYWIYLIIFILAVLTPEIVQHGYSFLNEEDLESLLVLLFGTFGIAVYFVKEKALIRLFKERLRLQKQANVITKDLSDSYSYIGEMNRRIDIVRDLVFRLPEEMSMAPIAEEGGMDRAYMSILEAVKLLSKAEAVALCFVETGTGRIVKRIDDGSQAAKSCLDDPNVTDTERTVSEGDSCIIIRSPRAACGVSSSIVFPKATNHVEDADMLRMVASEALSLYCIERKYAMEHAAS